MNDQAPRLCVVALVHRHAGPLGRQWSEILVGRRLKRDSAEGKVVLPGGGVRFKETLEAACCREVLEETGIEIYPESLLALGQVFQRIESDAHTVMVAFHARPLDVDQEPRGGSDLAAPFYIRESNLSELALSPLTRRILHAATYMVAESETS